MTPARHPLGEHLSTCSGPDDCAEYAAVLTMTPAQHANYINESTARFAQTRSASARTLRTSQEDFRPPDSYAPALARIRAATMTPEREFAERYAAERLAAFDAERGEMEPLPRLTAAELGEFAAPDPYALALATLKRRCDEHRDSRC